MTPFTRIAEKNRMKCSGRHEKTSRLKGISQVKIYLHAFLFSIFLSAVLAGFGANGVWARPAQDKPKNADAGKRNIKTEVKKERKDIESGAVTARRLISEGKNKEALSVIERLYKKYPESDVTVKLLADFYIRAGRGKKAIALLEKKLEVKPGDFELIRILGQAYLEMGDVENAEKSWRRILGGEKEQVPYYDNVAVLLWDAGQYENAVSVLREGAVGRSYRPRMRKIINWERILGNTEDAFKDELRLLSSQEKRRDLRKADVILEIFRESGTDTTLLSLFDSEAGGSENENEFLDLVKALLFAEAGMYKKAGKIVRGKNGGLPDEILYYSFIYSLAQMKHKIGCKDYEDFLLRSTDSFIEKYGKSRVVPEVILLDVKQKFLHATRRWPYDREKLNAAFAEAGSVLDHWAVNYYYDAARILMAEIQLEGMGNQEKALDILTGSKWRRKETGPKAKILRAKALSISKRGTETENELKGLISGSDSTVVSEVKFRLSEFLFYSGKYSEALNGFSKLAEEHPSDSKANDALELAILIKQGIDKEKGALDLFASARFYDNSRKLINAIDSLAMLEERFPESPLLPRVFLWRASLEVEAGMEGVAEEDILRLAEKYPMSVYAPAALEMLGDLTSQKSPDKALEQYGELIVRYPDNPFISRVRKKYMNLSKRVKMDSTGKAGAD